MSNSESLLSKYLDYLVWGLAGLSKNQKKILGMLEIKPDMTTKEIAEMIFGRIVEYKSKEYASTYRSLVSIEKQRYIQRVQIQLRWRVSEQKMKSKSAAHFKIV